jgi:hypothetical protein
MNTITLPDTDEPYALLITERERVILIHALEALALAQMHYDPGLVKEANRLESILSGQDSDFESTEPGDLGPAEPADWSNPAYRE